MASLLVALCIVSARQDKREIRYVPQGVVAGDTALIHDHLARMRSQLAADPAQAIAAGRLAFSLSEKANYYRGRIDSSRGLGRAFVNQGSLDSALFYHQYALRQAEAQNDSLEIGISLLKIGSIYRRLSDLNQAVAYSTKASRIIERFGEKTDLAELNDALQLIYFSLPNYKLAIGYGEKAVAQARELKNQSLLVQALSNLSMNYIENQQYERAEKTLVEAQELAASLHDVNAESAVLLNLAGVFLSQENYGALREYADRALLVNRQLGSREGECISLRALAIANLHEREYEKARELALQALQIAEANRYKIEQASCLKVLSNVAFAQQDPQEGERYFNRSNAIVEAVYNEAYLQSAAEYEKKYEAGAKDAKIKLQELQLGRKNMLNYLFLGASLVLVILIFLLYRNYNHKQKIQRHRISELEKEKQLTATEAVLKGEEKERIRLAKDLHDGLGGMLSGIKYSFQSMKTNLVLTPDNQRAFERSLDMLDSSILEMRRVAHNMMPESLVKFGLETAVKDFCSEINASGALQINFQTMGMEGLEVDQTRAIHFYRIVQELINNVIRHAQAHATLVQLTVTDTVLTLTVEDDGTGFRTDQLYQTKGMGWANIRNRVDFLGGTINLDSKPGKGTSVHIEVNL